MTQIPEASIVPLSIAIERLRTAGVELSRANPHPKDGSIVGVRAEALGSLTVVIARTQEQQRSLEEKDLSSTARQEVVQATEEYSRLAQLAERVRSRKASAEEYVSAIRAERDPARARMAVLQMAAQRQTVRVGSDEVVQGNPGVAITDLELNACERYDLRLTVQSVNTDTGEVNCKLLGGADLHRIFDESDLGLRVLHFRVVDEAMFLLSLCASVGATVNAVVAVRMALSAKGISFRCTLISFRDMKALSADLFTRLQNRYARLDGI